MFLVRTLLNKWLFKKNKKKPSTFSEPPSRSEVRKRLETEILVGNFLNEKKQTEILNQFMRKEENVAPGQRKVHFINLNRNETGPKQIRAKKRGNEGIDSSLNSENKMKVQG